MTNTNPNSADIEKWLALIRAESVGPITFARLLSHFGTIDSVLGASVGQLAQVDQIGSRTAEQIARTRTSFDSNPELELADKLGVWIINLHDDRYPPVLKRIYDPPPVLYIKGTLTSSDNLAVAIVGCRRCSSYGAEQASRFGHLLASAGFTIVSGMARGIDTAAHQGALAAAARTIAVQGCGLAKVFPPENEKLFQLIAESGCCISELPLQYEPLPENFPPRNRIIAGLALATIIIEAPYRSGALFTAAAAMENNREVMAVPGKIDSPLNRGAHQLIKQGAKLLEYVEDVMDALGYIGGQLKDHTADAAQKAGQKVEQPLFQLSQLNLSDAEQKIYNCLDSDPLHLDHIVEQTSLAAGPVNASLVSLQLKGLVKQLPGNMFRRR